MKKQDKIYEVENVSAKIKDAKSVAMANYKGMKVSQMVDLREKVREAGGELQVVKNSLMLRALRNLGYNVEDDKLQGTNITLYANSDEVSPLKILSVFAKKEQLLPFVVGFMNGKVFSAEEITKLANLPPKIELQAKLVGTLFSQPSRLVYSLNNNLQKLVMTLGQIRDKKSN